MDQSLLALFDPVKTWRRERRRWRRSIYCANFPLRLSWLLWRRKFWKVCSEPSFSELSEIFDPIRDCAISRRSIQLKGLPSSYRNQGRSLSRTVEEQEEVAFPSNGQDYILFLGGWFSYLEDFTPFLVVKGRIWPPPTKSKCFQEKEEVVLISILSLVTI